MGNRIVYDQSYDAHVNKGKSGVNIKNLFLDSGAYALYVRKVMPTGNYHFYDSLEFWRYVDKYANFIKAYKESFDHYANVDVIGDPDRSYEVQKYLESTHALSPVPAVHFGTSVRYLRRYLSEGYRYIAFGGLAFRRQAGKSRSAERWLDKMFTEVCPASNGYKPIVKVHGFGVTSFKTMSAYPWHSVDSTSYFKAAGYTGIYVPPKKPNGDWDFQNAPFHYLVGDRIAKSKVSNRDHIRHYQSAEVKFIGTTKVPNGMGGKKSPTSVKQDIRIHVEEWAKFIDIPMGSRSSDGEVEVPGITNNTVIRMRANVIYFGMFEKHFKTPEIFRFRTKKSPLGSLGFV